MVLPSQLPFHNPNETEEQIGYSNQEIGQRQIVRDVRKADFVGSVVAIEKVGLLQEALRSTRKQYEQENQICFLFN